MIYGTGSRVVAASQTERKTTMLTNIQLEDFKSSRQKMAGAGKGFKPSRIRLEVPCRCELEIIWKRKIDART